jgi:hypothetical protein
VAYALFSRCPQRFSNTSSSPCDVISVASNIEHSLYTNSQDTEPEAAGGAPSLMCR